MRHPFFWISLLALSLSSSCWVPEKETQVWTMPRTTDSLAFEIFGLRLGDTYSEQSLFDTLRLHIDGLKRLSEMKGDDWVKDTPQFLRLKDDSLVYGAGRLSNSILDLGGIPLYSTLLYTTPEGVLYEISVSQSSRADKYDRNTAEVKFKAATAELAKSLGSPVLRHSPLRESKYFSFRKGTIEHVFEGDTLEYHESMWSDGSRQLTFGYESSFSPEPYFFLRLEDKAISREMKLDKQVPEKKKRFRLF